MTESRFFPTMIPEPELLARCDYFADCNIWPPRQTLEPRAWLENFRQTERAHARSLLNAFLYYNETLCDALFRSAALALSSEITLSATSLAQAKALWRGFLARLRVTYVQGERPNPTDSGRVFARKARQVLHLEENQILDPAAAVLAVRRDPDLAVLFVDDFVGSGSQMHSTWFRIYENGLAGGASFAQLASSGSGRYLYAPLLCTSKGLARMQEHCEGLVLRPSHLLDESYTLTSPECVLWPEDLKPTAVQFLEEVSTRAGIVQNYEHGWRGFDDLALAVAFWNSVPDATLPLFFWNEGSWSPLIERS